MNDILLNNKNRLHIVDSNDSLKLFSFNGKFTHHFEVKNESESKSNSDSESDNELMKCRSLFVDNEDNVVGVSFPYTHEFHSENFIDSALFKNYNPQEWSFSHSYEGTIINVFKNENSWQISTLKRLDAYKSKWGDIKSFGELFEEEVLKYYSNMEDFFSGLNGDYLYTFLLPTNFKSRVVCKNEGCVIYTGSFKRDDGSYSFLDGLKFEYAQFTQNVSLSQLYQDITNTNIYKHQGVFGYNSHTHQFVKIYNQNYLNAKVFRGNEPDIRKRYLQTMRDDEFHRRFREHFDSARKLFRRMDGSLHAFVRDIINEKLNQEFDQAFLNHIQNDKHFVNKNHKHVLNYVKSLNVEIIWNSIMKRMQHSLSQN